jgi:predicted nucleic acid-binding protein
VTLRAIVLDANILLRVVLGRRVARLLSDYAQQVTFLTPDVAFDDVREHLPAILSKRGETLGLQGALDTLAALQGVVQVLDHAEYQVMKHAALARVGQRDPDDWPIMACALLLNCPIWTEDRDFFGTGVATWTTTLVEQYFANADQE